MTHDATATPLLAIAHENEIDANIMDDERREERRSDSGGRRHEDRRPEGRNIVAIAGFVLTLIVVLWSSARSVAATQLAVNEIAGLRVEVTKMNEKLNTAALAANDTNKEVEFLRRQFEEYKREQFAADQLRDTYIKDDREKIIALQRK